MKCTDLKGYDLMCCKTTVRPNRQLPQDFYCFLDKGTPEGNEGYCLGLADYPPPILAWQTDDEKNNVRWSTYLRAKVKKQKQHYNRRWVCWVIFNISFMCFALYKRWISRYLEK